MSNPHKATPFQVPRDAAPARVAQAVADMNLDALNSLRGVDLNTVINTKNDTTINDRFIDGLWANSKNRDVIEAFMNNDFIWFAAQNGDDVVLPYYQAYGIQDYFYLIDYIRFKALRLTTVLDNDWADLQAEAQGLTDSVKWVNEWRTTLTTDMKLTNAQIDGAERSIAELAYANVLQRRTSVDDWFDLHVIMIPCVWGWPLLANAVDRDPRTKKDTIFYKTWVKPNLDAGSAQKLSAFLDANQTTWTSGVDRGPDGDKSGKWNSLFRMAMKLEVGLFKASGK